jgi:terminase, large subunit
MLLSEPWLTFKRKDWAPGMKPPRPMRLSQWAEEHFYLSAESSYIEQRWRCYPPQRAIMDCISHDAIREVDLIKSARVGYTKMIDAAIGYFAQHKRRNQCVWQPTDEDADDFVKTEVDTMLRDVPVMTTVFPEMLRHDRNNTLRAKHFLGSVLHIRGGKAAKNYRRLTLDVAYLDELDGFDADIEKEGSPVILSAKRLEGATFPKHVLGSTPKLKHFSLIEARFHQAERRFRFHTPCPECNTEHVVTWGGKDTPHGMKWTPGEPDTVRQLCPHCGALYSQQDFLRVWTSGRYIDETGAWIDPECIFRAADGTVIAPPRHVGFHLWTAQSAQATWSQIVREFLAAQAKAKHGDKSELKTFVNTTLGETWEEEVQQADEHQLRARAEPYQMRTCPRGVLMLTAGVDVQDRRWEISVWGWGRGEESWLIDHMILEGNPADERDWDRLDTYLKTRFTHEGGQTLPIEAIGVDTGGHFTHQAYNFCRTRSARRIFALQGGTRQGLPIKGRSSLQDVNYRGAVIKGGVRLWTVGTDTAKDLLFGRFEIQHDGPGRVHFTRDLPPEWFAQLTAEARVLQRTAQGEVWRWVKRQTRNEALDCAVYATFAAHAMDLPRYTDAMWARIEERVNPVQGDLLAGPAIAPENPDESGDNSAPTPPNPRNPAPIRRSGSNFANRWGR